MIALIIIAVSIGLVAAWHYTRPKYRIRYSAEHLGYFVDEHLMFGMYVCIRYERTLVKAREYLRRVEAAPSHIVNINDE